jgi:hypothetical protein
MGKVSVQSDEEILAALREEQDIFGADGTCWRMSAGEGKIKSKGSKAGQGWKTVQKIDDPAKLAKTWEDIKRLSKQSPLELVVRECVDNAQVLPPASKMKPVAGLPCTPASLVEQYGKALSGTLEIVRFGAMLCDLDDALSEASDKAPQGRRGDESLKGYLETHCPTVNYKTAIGFKALADDLREHCKIPAKVPLSLAIPNADGTPFLPESSPIPLPKLEKIQHAVWGMIDGKSTRQVRIGMGSADASPKGGARDGAGRKAKEPDAARDAGAAWALIGREIDLATGWKFTRFLPAAIAREALSTVSLLQAALKARIEELGQEV